MDLALLACLILLNGLFAMSEMALTAARKVRLQVMVDDELMGARSAIALHENPTKFLSTVQIGITSIGMLNGIVGEAAFAGPLSVWLIGHAGLAPAVASVTSTAVVIVSITLVTIIFGELVPKRIGQMFPETVSRLVATPMEWLSTAALPFVALLSICTRTTLRLLGVQDTRTSSVTSEEIAAQLEEGVDAGIIEEHEHRMVRNVFRLEERQIGSMMVPRAEIAWLGIDHPNDDVLHVLATAPHARYPVCRGGLDDVVGVVAAQHLLQQALQGDALSLAEHLQAPVFLPETLTGMELLEHFRASGVQTVFVVDEYGEVQGLITAHDVLESIAGEFVTDSEDDAWAVQRADGSWLLDGLIPVPELKDRLGLKETPEEDRGRYNTLAGMIMLLLGHLPRTTDSVDWEDWRFEVVDLDGKRVDKVLASRIASTEEGLSAVPMTDGAEPT